VFVLDSGILSRFANPYRLACYLLIVFVLGHTLGAVVTTPDFGPASAPVVSMMKSVHVPAQGFDVTWYKLFRGFGAFISVFFTFSIVVTWYLGGASARQRLELTPISWSMFLSYAACSIIAWKFLFLTPIVFSTAIALLLGIGCVRDRLAGGGAAVERP
jgi:hypothetical protein